MHARNEQQLTRRVLISNRGKVDNASAQLCALPCMEHPWHRSSCRKEIKEKLAAKGQSLTMAATASIRVLIMWTLIDTFHFHWLVPEETHQAWELGIGMKGNEGWSNVTVSCTKVTTIKISVEVATGHTPPVLAPDIDS